VGRSVTSLSQQGVFSSMNFCRRRSIILSCNGLHAGCIESPPRPQRTDSLRAIAQRYNSGRPELKAQRFSGWARISPVTDPELIASARLGNREAFGALVERYAPQVRRLTRTILGKTTDAEDAAQEAFLSAWKALDRFDPALPLGPWLTRIALNAARDLRRRQRVRHTEQLPETLVSSGPSPERSAGQLLLRERIETALAALPERQRIALVLFDVEGYSHAEVAAQLDIPEGTARSEVFHARRRMRSALGPWEEESR